MVALGFTSKPPAERGKREPRGRQHLGVFLRAQVTGHMADPGHEIGDMGKTPGNLSSSPNRAGNRDG